MKKKAKKAAKGGRKSSVKDLTAKKAGAVKGGAQGYNLKQNVKV